MSSRQFERISKALGDSHRLAILRKLKQKDTYIDCADISEVVHLAQSTISHHVKHLVDAEILLPIKEGRNMKYALNKQALYDYIGIVAMLIQ